jgi:putative membrane protein
VCFILSGDARRKRLSHDVQSAGAEHLFELLNSVLPKRPNPLKVAAFASSSHPTAVNERQSGRKDRLAQLAAALDARSGFSSHVPRVKTGRSHSVGRTSKVGRLRELSATPLSRHDATYTDRSSRLLLRESTASRVDEFNQTRGVRTMSLNSTVTDRSSRLLLRESSSSRVDEFNKTHGLRTKNATASATPEDVILYLNAKDEDDLDKDEDKDFEDPLIQLQKDNLKAEEEAESGIELLEAELGELVVAKAIVDAADKIVDVKAKAADAKSIVDKATDKIIEETIGAAAAIEAAAKAEKAKADKAKAEKAKAAKAASDTQDNSHVVVFNEVGVINDVGIIHSNGKEISIEPKQGSRNTLPETSGGKTEMSSKLEAKAGAQTADMHGDQKEEDDDDDENEDPLIKLQKESMEAEALNEAQADARELMETVMDSQLAEAVEAVEANTYGAWKPAWMSNRSSNESFDGTTVATVEQEGDSHKATKTKQEPDETSRSESEVERIRKIFLMLDKNKDGSIDRSELVRVLQSFNPTRWTDARVDGAMAAVDLNKDGKIQFEEFLSWAAKNNEGKETEAGIKAGRETAGVQKDLRTKKGKGASKNRKQMVDTGAVKDDEEEQMTEENEEEEEEEEIEGDRKVVKKAPERVWEEPAGIFSPAYEGTRRYISADWMKNLRTLPQSLVVRRIRSPLLFNTLSTLVICLTHQFWGTMKGLPSLPHQLLGSALSLLLVFRNNRAYDRFWEARKQWDIVTREAREIAGLATAFMTPKQALPILGLISAYPQVMMNYLKGERDMKTVETLTGKQEVDALKTVLNQPQYILARLRQLAMASAAAGVNERFRDYLLQSVRNLGDTVSVCERIFNTPIPLHYSRHLSRFLSMYLLTLPLVLIGPLGWWSVPVTAIVGWALLGIQEIGNMIEEPFSAIDDEQGRALLPMSEICRTIRRDVRAIAAAQQVAHDFGTPTITRQGVGGSYSLKGLPEGLKDFLNLFDSDEENTDTFFPTTT